MQDKDLRRIRQKIDDVLNRYETGHCYPSTDLELVTMTSALSIATEALLVCMGASSDSANTLATKALEEIAEEI